MKRFFVRLNKTEVLFDEVPQTVFAKRDYALSDDGETPRYSKNFIVLDGETIEQLNLAECPVNTLGLVCRLLNVTPTTGNVPGGFVRSPSHIKFRDNRRAWLVELSTGLEYRQAQKAA